jgi:hypothetical protein
VFKIVFQVLISSLLQLGVEIVSLWMAILYVGGFFSQRQKTGTLKSVRILAEVVPLKIWRGSPFGSIPPIKTVEMEKL